MSVVLYMSFDKFLLAVESRDLSQADKSITRVFLSQSWVMCKAEIAQVGTFFNTQFPSLGIFINKKVGNRKNQDHPVYNFLNWYNKSGLSFFDFQLFFLQKFPGKEIECGLAAVIQL